MLRRYPCEVRDRTPGRTNLFSAAAIAILSLGACAPQLPPVSADTSCERFRHISATDAQIKVFSDNWEIMETYADQIVAQNIEYDKTCLPVVK